MKDTTGNATDSPNHGETASIRANVDPDVTPATGYQKRVTDGSTWDRLQPHKGLDKDRPSRLPVRKPLVGFGTLNEAALNQALEIARDENWGNHQSVITNLTTLSGIIGELWRHAETASDLHKILLSLIDNAVLQCLTAQQISSELRLAIRAGFSDLLSHQLAKASVDSIAERLAEAGLSLLAPICDIELNEQDSASDSH